MENEEDFIQIEACVCVCARGAVRERNWRDENICCVIYSLVLCIHFRTRAE